MDTFSTSLLREKFVIRDPSPLSDEEPVVALSNRLVTPMPGGKEKFIIRGQNMHTCIRMAARLIASSQDYGPIMNRPTPFDWDDVWNAVTDGFEKTYNDRIWVAVYMDGKVVFSKGDHHAFLDIIETCDHKSAQDYSSSINMAENAFKQAGKIVTIEYDPNIALVVNITPDIARCGIILRGAAKTTTFNFTAKKKNYRKVKIPQCFYVSAAFLEGIQLAYSVGTGREKIHFGIIEKGTTDFKRVKAGEKRLKSLEDIIRQFEKDLDVHYRPERPKLSEFAYNAREVANKILTPEIIEKIESGELNKEDWVL